MQLLAFDALAEDTAPVIAVFAAGTSLGNSADSPERSANAKGK
jgi:hypothetical protein